MPRVLRIINRLNLGGPTYNAAYLSALLQPDYETMLVAGMRDESEESSEFILEKMNLRPHYIRAMRREINLKDDLQAFRDIKKIIQEFKPDIVHTHAAKSGTLGRIAAHQMKVPVILHTFHGHIFQGYFNKPKTRFFIGIERQMARISTGIIALSEHQKHDLSRVYRICPPEKIKIIPLGFDLSRIRNAAAHLRSDFRNKYNLDDETLAIGIIGRLVPIKNHTLFIQAWKNVLQRTSKKIHAFIIGDGEDRAQLEQQCIDSGITFNTAEHPRTNASLTFTSWIHEIEVAISGLDIVVLSSNSEGTPVSLIEAQAGGKAILTTDVGGIRDTVLPDETALIVPPGREDAFAEGLLRLIHEKNLRKSMAAKGPSFVQQRFEVKRLVDDMKGYYEELLMQKGVSTSGVMATAQTPSPTTVRETGEAIRQSTEDTRHKGKIRVMHVVNRLNLGGITYNAACIAHGLKPEFETRVVCGIKDPYEESSEFIMRKVGIEPIYVEEMHRTINPINDWKAYRHILGLILKFRPDIVHTHGAKAGVLGRIAAWRAGVPVIIHTYHGHVFHSYFGKLKTRFFLIMERMLSKITTAIVAISKLQKEELSKVYKISRPEKFHIIELGYDLGPFATNSGEKRALFRASYKISEDTLLVGTIGRIVPIKNIPLIIEAWLMIDQDIRRKARLFIIGDGEQRKEMENICERNRLRISTPEKRNPEAEIIFTSWIQDSDMAMAGLDIVALSSLNEGTPASLIEAMASGKPIVTTGVGGIPDMVTEGQTALIVESGNAAQLAHALEKLMTDAGLRSKMSENGPPFARKRYASDRLITDMNRFYHDLIDSVNKA